MKRLFFLILIFFISKDILAQTTNIKTLDAKVGTGAAFLGSGDKLVAKIEGELTKRWNRILSNSLSLNFGYGNSSLYTTSYYLNETTFTTHLDGNIFVSPFGNEKIFNFKIGTGFSLMYVSDSQNEYVYSYSKRRASVGYSLIVENEVNISVNYLLGLKMIMQPYFNGDISSGLLLKFGRQF